MWEHQFHSDLEDCNQQVNRDGQGCQALKGGLQAQCLEINMIYCRLSTSWLEREVTSNNKSAAKCYQHPCQALTQTVGHLVLVLMNPCTTCHIYAQDINYQINIKVTIYGLKKTRMFRKDG